MRRTVTHPGSPVRAVRAGRPTTRLGTLAVVALLAGGLAACGGEDEAAAPRVDPGQQPTTRVVEPGETLDARPGPTEPTVVDTVATGLEAPWGLAFLPDGSALVTERDSTRLLHLVPSGDSYDVEEVTTIDAAAPQGESGLLGVAVSPTYAEDSQVFLYVSTAEDNRVLRGSFDGGALTGLEPVLTDIPNGFIHDGGRLAFGPDDHLYVSTGEIGEPDLAQDPASLGGKVLRITTDGDPAPGNPDPDSPVFSLGHRNVQGLAFDDQDRLWASEFGANAWDELNLLDAGVNYGWPQVEGIGGDDTADRFRDPYAQWATSEASPSGLAYAEGSLWMAALRGNRLWQVPVTDDGVGEPEPHLVGDYGRLRTVVVAPDGMLWVTTSNRDGRGEPAAQDDRILRVDPGSSA